MRVALYARVSTDDQHAENQLLELRRYVAARGWAPGLEFVDEGISGAKTRRAALDRLMLAARRRQVDVVVCWRLDRLGRDLAHLLAVVNEWTTLGVAFVSLARASTRRRRRARCSSTSWARSRSSNEDACGSASWPAWRAPNARAGVWVGDGRRRCLRARRGA